MLNYVSSPKTSHRLTWHFISMSEPWARDKCIIRITEVVLRCCDLQRQCWHRSLLPPPEGWKIPREYTDLFLKQTLTLIYNFLQTLIYNLLPQIKFLVLRLCYQICVEKELWDTKLHNFLLISSFLRADNFTLFFLHWSLLNELVVWLTYDSTISSWGHDVWLFVWQTFRRSV